MALRSFSRPFSAEGSPQPPRLCRHNGIPDPRNGLLLRSRDHVRIRPQRHGGVRVPQQRGNGSNVVSGNEGLGRAEVPARMQANALALDPDLGGEGRERL
jgi:hypothetical protein